MKQNGFIGLIALLITILILALLFMATNPFRSRNNNELESITTPKGIEKTQDVVDKYQQKSIERQNIEVK